MRPVYSTVGADRRDNGNCFQACLATMLGKLLNDVPNFLHGTMNGEPLSDDALLRISTWLKRNNCGGYVEFGFNTTSIVGLTKQIYQQVPNSFYILTGLNRQEKVHSVVCFADHVIHDPATSPGHCTVEKPCNDGYFRIGFLLYKSI